MIRRSPAEVFIKYLLLHPKKYSNEQIIIRCREVQLDVVSLSYIERLAEKLEKPAVFRPHDRRHAASYKYLLLKGLAPIFHRDADGNRAFELLELPRAKEFIEAMTLSGAPNNAIAHYLTKQKIARCTTETIDKYCYFFWNLNLVDSTEVRSLLQLRAESALQSSDPSEKAHYEALKRAWWNDPRKIASDLPSSPFSAMIAQVKVGIMPATVDRTKVLDLGINILSLRILEAALNNGPKDSTHAVEYANALRIVKEVRDDIVPPDAQLQKDLRAITLRTETKPLTNLHALTKGDHTVTGLPSLEEVKADQKTMQEGPYAEELGESKSDLFDEGEEESDDSI